MGTKSHRNLGLGVMLSGAKHLWISLEPVLKPEILRFAQDDNSSSLVIAIKERRLR